MQPTEMQVERSLAALRAGRAHDEVLDARPEVSSAVAAAVAGSPDVRAERLEAAQARLASGEGPSDEDLAGRMVGRIVCDRLR